MKGEDKLRGSFFENAVFEALAAGGTLTYSIHGANDVTTEKPTQRLQKGYISRKDARKVKPVANNNYCYYCSETTGVDIILKVSDKVYFIQCSVAKLDKLTSKKGFWKSAKPNWVPILITPYSDLKEKLLSKPNATFTKEYTSQRFHISYASPLLEEDVISLVTSNTGQ